LLEYGFQPGKELGQLLHAAYEAQLAGEFNDLTSGMRWISESANTPPQIRETIRTRIEF
jgi:hypothetical protein